MILELNGKTSINRRRIEAARSSQEEPGDRDGRGLGKAEQERLFWERVASDRQRKQSWFGRRPRPSPPSPKSTSETTNASPAESAEMAILTILCVVVFGLGWATVESQSEILEIASTHSRANGYDGVASHSGIGSGIGTREGIEWTKTPSPLR